MSETTSEWLRVAHSDPGGDYAWDAFDVHYSEGSFFWTHQMGCSCNSLDDYILDRSLYQKGERGDVYKAITQWGGGRFGSITDATRLIEQVFHWKVPEPLNKPMTEEEIANDEGRV